MKIGISACLLGEKVRYDGTDKRNDGLISLLEGNEIVSICPEKEAGFPVPHEPLEIRDGTVLSASGKDISEKLRKGSEECLEKVKDCDLLILKSKSPSCGIGKIYDGSFSGKLVEGDGLFVQLCRKKKVILLDENDLEMIKKILNGRK